MDASRQLCCSPSSKIHYDASGKSSCINDCPLDKLYKNKYCCDSMGQGCSSVYTPTSCNPSYYIQNSCEGCPSFCGSDSQLCSNSSSKNSCTPQCNLNEIYYTDVGCLKCDSSCLSCSFPMNSSKCIGCALGYTLVQSTCQACSINCLTCS